jgi:acylphosphatase
MKAGAHVFVSGRVQGVFFRVETQREAMKHNVVGWIRNTSDGKVEAVIEGEKEDVKKLVDFCKHGPSSAHVADLDVKWGNYSGMFESFKIRHTRL